jgi:hypothetical protein
MEYETVIKKENFLIVYEKVSWIYLEDEYFIEFSNHVNIFSIDTMSCFLIDDEGKVYIVSYDKKNTVNVNIDLGDNMQFRYVKLSNESRSGFSLVYYPLNVDDRNEWGDMVQYELDLINLNVGNKIGTVR